jgi:Uma2 family endonuclease
LIAMHAEAPDAPRRHRLTVEEYFRMVEVGILRPRERVELIEGEILDMAPVAELHGGTVAQLIPLLQETLGKRAVLWVQSTVILDRRSAPEPDFAVLRPRADFYKKSGLPRPADILLIIEVADSSLRHDRDTKAPLYARQAIPEYWLVDVRGKHLTRYRDPGAEGYARVDEPDLGEPVSIPGVEGAAVVLAPLFAD